eukprot:2927793-Pleurochrysis_carterae.AAC.3
MCGAHAVAARMLERERRACGSGAHASMRVRRACECGTHAHACAARILETVRRTCRCGAHADAARIGGGRSTDPIFAMNF